MPPKTLQDGNCIDTVQYLTGVTYEAFLKLIPNETDIPAHDLDETASSAWHIYHNYLVTLGVSHLVYERKMFFQRSTQNAQFIGSFMLHCKVYFGKSDTQSNVFVNSLLDLQKDEKLFVTRNTTSAKWFRMMLDYHNTTKLNDDAVDSSNVTDISRTELLVGIMPTLNNFVPGFVADMEPILVTKVLGCPLIELEPSEYKFDQGKMTIHIRNMEANVQPDIYLVKYVSNQSTVYICAEDFVTLSEQLNLSSTSDSADLDSISPQGILSLICTCISLLCLLLTLITYSLFQILRTQPGVNNIPLVICLIIAQSLFQFGTNQAAVVTEWGCQVIGVLVHYFWLMTMFWMNACCVHMLRVFIAIKTPIKRKKICKQTVIYTTYTVVFSTILVLTNITVSVAHPDYEGMGYGGSLCYITDHRMVGYVFAVPVGLVISCNLSLFLVVVVKICRTPTIKSDTKSTQNMCSIYVKLSTITGITWLFGFIYTFTAVEALGYVFVILNASQGVFIFFAFICNKRVLAMYRLRSGQFEFGLSRVFKSKDKSTGTAMTAITTKNKVLRSDFANR